MREIESYHDHEPQDAATLLAHLEAVPPLNARFPTRQGRNSEGGFPCQDFSPVTARADFHFVAHALRSK
ncbi:hypothetical protein [Fontivita pretiosa]|uniref:hypothetical protein n=1 Tax=Fontivita pretiosa TaxID=2989684 RepID=UPI003D16CB43